MDANSPSNQAIYTAVKKIPSKDQKKDRTSNCDASIAGIGDKPFPFDNRPGNAGVPTQICEDMAKEKEDYAGDAKVCRIDNIAKTNGSPPEDKIGIEGAEHDTGDNNIL